MEESIIDKVFSDKNDAQFLKIKPREVRISILRQPRNGAKLTSGSAKLVGGPGLDETQDKACE
jgi:hypothetical protein